MRASLKTWSLKIWTAALLLVAAGLTRAIADENPARLEGGDVLRGKFVQERHLEGFGTPLQTTGQFLLAPDKGLIWQAEQPFATITVMTTQGILQVSDDIETMNLPTSQVPILAQLYDTLGAALAGDLKALERNFQVERRTDAGGWHLVLKPHGGGSVALQEIRIDGNRFVEHVNVLKGGGDRDSLTFLDQAIDQAPLSEVEAQLLAKPGQQ